MQPKRVISYSVLALCTDIGAQRLVTENYLDLLV